MAWAVHLIDREALTMVAGVIDEGDLGPLTTARVEDYSFKRNGIGEANITFHVTDPLAATDLRFGQDDPLKRELWIYEDSTLRFMGAPSSARLSADRQTVQMRLREAGPQYLAGKVFGRADRVNLVENPGAEDDNTDPAPWDEEDPGGVITVTVDTGEANEGSNSFKIVGTANGSGYITQTLTSTVDHAYGPGLILSLAAWCKVDAAMADVPEGTLLAQLVAFGEVAAVPIPGSPYVGEFTIPSNFTYGVWERIECQVLLGANIDWTVGVRLYGVDGEVHWDSVQVSFPDATTVTAGSDLGDLIKAAVEYSQDPSSGQSSEVLDHDFGDLGIVPSGPVGWAHDLHEYIWPALMDLCDEYGIDIWWNLERNFEAAVHRGSTLAGFATTVTSAGGSTFGGYPVDESIGMDYDPDQQFSAYIVTGEGQSFNREETGAVDTSRFGGLVKTKFEHAPASATVLSMAARAQIRILEGARPAALPTVAYYVADLDDAPEPGDVIAMGVDFGCFQFNVTGDPIDLRVEAIRVFHVGQTDTYWVAVTFDEDWAA